MAAVQQQKRGLWDDDDFMVRPEDLLPAKRPANARNTSILDCLPNALLYFPIPKGTKDAITGVEIKEGDVIVDFIRSRAALFTYESELDRYYLDSSFVEMKAKEEGKASWEGMMVGVARFRAKYF